MYRVNWDTEFTVQHVTGGRVYVWAVPRKWLDRARRVLRGVGQPRVVTTLLASMGGKKVTDMVKPDGMKDQDRPQIVSQDPLDVDNLEAPVSPP